MSPGHTPCVTIAPDLKIVIQRFPSFLFHMQRLSEFPGRFFRKLIGARTATPIRAKGFYRFIANKDPADKDIFLSPVQKMFAAKIPLFSAESKNNHFVLSGLSGKDKKAFLEDLAITRARVGLKTYILDTDGDFFADDSSVSKEDKARLISIQDGMKTLRGPFLPSPANWDADLRLIAPLLTFMLNKNEEKPVFEVRDIYSIVDILHSTKGFYLNYDDLIIALDAFFELKGLTKVEKDLVLNRLQPYQPFFEHKSGTREDNLITVINFGSQDAQLMTRKGRSVAYLLNLFHMADDAKWHYRCIDEQPLVIIASEGADSFLDFEHDEIIEFFEAFYEMAGSDFNDFWIGFSFSRSQADIERTSVGKSIVRYSATHLLMSQWKTVDDYLKSSESYSQWFKDHAQELLRMQTRRNDFPPNLPYTDLCIKKDHTQTMIKFVLNEK